MSDTGFEWCAPAPDKEEAGLSMSILVLRKVAPELIEALERLAPVHVRPELRDPAEADPALLQGVQAVVTGAVVGLSEAMMAACPALRLVHFIGAGHEGIDLEAARRHGLRVSTGRGGNADSVADHAVALLLAVLRKLPELDAEVRRGVWIQQRSIPQLTGARVGLIGMGEIGTRIARRLAGFDVKISHVARSPKPDLPWPQVGDAVTLAHGVDHLVVACPLTPATRHMVDAAVLAALGPQGVLVNIGRGGVVDTDALIEALAEGRIAGAGLDVVEGEPDVPEALLRLPWVLITPHIAAMSPQAAAGMVQLAIANVRAALEGWEPVSPVL